MIRQALRLAVEAAKVEVRNLVDVLTAAGTLKAESESPREPAVVLRQVAKLAAPSKWSSPAFHTEALKSTKCPDCDKPKKVGSYRCRTCAAVARRGAP